MSGLYEIKQFLVASGHRAMLPMVAEALKQFAHTDKANMPYSNLIHFLHATALFTDFAQRKPAHDSDEWKQR